MKKEAEIQYNAFLENGDLEMLLPKAKGNWEEDKDRFIKVWEKTQELINNINIK